MSELRIPLDIAINEPRLLKTRFEELSTPQRAMIKTMYGLALASDPDPRGWSEQDYWLASQGFGEFDELGYLIRLKPGAHPSYVPEEFGECWLNEGVRSGKSTIASFIISYEAVCGGHEEFVRPGRRLYCFQIAQDLRQAKYALHDIQANLESIPFLARPLKSGGSRIQAVTADRIDLWNGVTIATTPPTVKSVRGYDSPAAVLDEVAVWYQEADSANPDFEIYRQVKSRQAQFARPKIVGLSSPWNKGGLLYSRVKAGTNGVHVRCEDHEGQVLPRGACSKCDGAARAHRSHLVMTMPTAAMFNPNVGRQWLEEYRDADPRAFRRECMAEFLDSVSGFLDSDLIREAVMPGVRSLPPRPEPIYVAAMDPAFKRDSFAFAIGHMDEKGRMVFDVMKRWKRDLAATPLSPETILKEIAEVARAYRVGTIYTDQHEINSLKVLALQQGLSLVEMSLQSGSKNDIFANLASLVNQRRIRLLDHEDSIGELLALERKLTQGGNISISAPLGQHDDLAIVIALVAQQAIWLAPASGPDLPDAEAHEDRRREVHEQIAEQIQARFVASGDGEWGGIWD